LLDMDLLAAHCVHLNEDEIETLSEYGIYVSYNPTSNMKLASGIAPVASMSDNNVEVALGTDGPASNNDLDMFEEMRTGSFLQKVENNDPTALPADEIFGMATRVGADALGFRNVGLLAEGYRADMVVINRDNVHWKPEHNTISNLIYSSKSCDIEKVFVDGNLVYDNGRPVFIDENEVIERVEEIADKYREF